MCVCVSVKIVMYRYSTHVDLTHKYVSSSGYSIVHCIYTCNTMLYHAIQVDRTLECCFFFFSTLQIYMGLVSPFEH